MSIELKFEDCDLIDMSVRRSRDDTDFVYIGRSSSVIIFPLEELDRFIRFVELARVMVPESEE